MSVRRDLELRDQWVSQGKKVAAATVVRVSGSAPRPVGARMLVSDQDDMEGSVSGGCVENDVFLRAQEVLKSGTPQLITYGIADDDAFEVGLACGGTIQVFVEPWLGEILAALAELSRDERFGARLTVVSGRQAGWSAVIDANGLLLAGSLPEEVVGGVVGDAVKLIAREQHATLGYGETEVFVEIVIPRPHLVIFGAVHVGQALATLSPHLGYHVTVADARSAFNNPQRFPSADEILVGWPDQLAHRLSFDARTFVVVLSHDARFEDPLWPLVLTSPARYIGAMGSRKTAARRAERLLTAGFTTEQIARIHGPIGLDIGGRTPEETAVAILAEMTSTRYGHGHPLELVGEVRPIGETTAT